MLRPVQVSPAERIYRTPAEELELSLLCIAPDAPFVSSSEHGPELLLGLQGSATIAADGAAWPLGPGRWVFVPAGVGSYRIEGEVLIIGARVPIPPPPRPA